MNDYHFLRMADWFQYAALGGLVKRFSGETPRPWSASRPSGPNPDLTRKKEFWDVHDLVHGPQFEVRTNVVITHTAALCSTDEHKLLSRAKADALEVHFVTCGYDIIYSAGRLPQVGLVIDKCETCGHDTERTEEIPASGSGFMDRAGREPVWDKDEWRLLYRPNRLLRYITKGEERYWISEFRLQLDNIDGKPLYWRLDDRPWYLK